MLVVVRRRDDALNHGAFLLILKVRTSRSRMGLGKGLPHPLNGLDLEFEGVRLVSSSFPVSAFKEVVPKTPDALLLFFCSHPALRCQGAHSEPTSTSHHRQTGQGCPGDSKPL